MGENQVSGIDKSPVSSPHRSPTGKAMIALALVVVAVIGTISTALVLGIFSEPDIQYERTFDHVFTYDGPGLYYEDRFFWISWSSNGTHLISNRGGIEIAFWNITLGGLSSWKSVDMPVQDPREGKAIWDIEANPVVDVVAVGWSQGVAMYDLDGNLLSQIRGGTAYGVAWSPSGGLIAASWFNHTTNSASLRVFGYPGFLDFSSKDLDETLHVLEWSPNGQLIAGCQRWSGLYIFDSNLLEKLHLEKYSCDWSLSWSPDSSTILLGKEGGMVLFDVDSAEEKAFIPRSSKTICGSDLEYATGGWARSGAFSPTGSMIAVAYSNGNVEIWTGDGKKRLDTLLFRPCVNNPPKVLHTVKWSLDGTMVAVSGEHGITVWERKS